MLRANKVNRTRHIMNQILELWLMVNMLNFEIVNNMYDQMDNYIRVMQNIKIYEISPF